MAAIGSFGVSVLQTSLSEEDEKRSEQAFKADSAK